MRDDRVHTIRRELQDHTPGIIVLIQANYEARNARFTKPAGTRSTRDPISATLRRRTDARFVSTSLRLSIVTWADGTVAGVLADRTPPPAVPIC